MTNAEVMIQGLQVCIENDFPYESGVTSYIECPYVLSIDCHFDESADACHLCKLEWLQKEWSD